MTTTPPQTNKRQRRKKTQVIEAEEIKTTLIADDHRHKCYWEVIYNSKIKLGVFKPLSIHSVNEIRNNSDHLKHYVIDVKTPDAPLTSEKPITQRIFIENATFDICDIRGNNKGQKITFRKCTFKNVYFGHSFLSYVNFESCIFKDTSFALSHFYRCSFDEKCTFEKISVSGGKTNFEDSIINAEDLIFNSYKYATDEYCKERNLDRAEQIYRMNLSLVKLSRNILSSVTLIGDDDAYYNAVKTLFRLRVREKESKIKFRTSKIEQECNSSTGFFKWLKLKSKLLLNKSLSLLFPLERAILTSFGFINGWGSSFIRCIIFGFMIFSFYSICYIYQAWPQNVSLVLATDIILKCMIKSIDITFLVGYTKHTLASDDALLQLLTLSNMMLGLVWYGVSFPTLINKISMARI